MLKDAASWLRGQILGNLAVTVSYKHGTQTSSLQAVVGSTRFRAEDEYGIVVVTETRDFLVSAEDFSGEPAKGDRITWNGRIYEVLAPNGEPVWRWSDAYHGTIRIHTKEIGETEEGN